MSITFGGLATGLDTNALIDGLMAVEAIPLARNQAKQTSLSSAKSTLSSFLNTVVAIKTAAEGLDTEAEVASFTATAGDTDKLVTTVTGSAQSGSYQVDVDFLALETRTKSDPFASATSALGDTGDLEITVGGSTMVAVSIVAGDSLADVATKINSSDARVNASVIYDGSDHRLLIRGNDTGSVNEVVYNETGSVNLGVDTGSDPANTYQNAQNAQIQIDSQFTIVRASNAFTDVIPGMTLTAVETTTSAITVSIEPDADGQKSKLQALVSAYNTAISAGHLAAGYGSIKANNSDLSGDSAIRTTLDSLAQTVTQSLSGLSGKYTMLAAVGVNMTQGGNLEIDETVLTDALNDDPQAVAKVFVGDPDASVTGMMELLVTAVERLAEDSDSVVNNRMESFADRITRLEEDELALERRLDDYEARLRKKYTNLETLVSQIQNQGNAVAGLAKLPGFTNS